jgi:hypothetical protein
MSDKKQQVGYIYLLREREFIRINEPTYKIGKTSQDNPYGRITDYPKDSKLEMVISTQDCHTAERALITLFRNKFKIMRCYGCEYFNGDVNVMKDYIWEYLKKLSNVLTKDTMMCDMCKQNKNIQTFEEYTVNGIRKCRNKCRLCCNDLRNKRSTHTSDIVWSDLNVLYINEGLGYLWDDLAEPDDNIITPPELEPTKICCRCGITKALTDFGAYSRNKKDGKRYNCKVCENTYKRDARQNKKIIQESSVAFKITEIKNGILMSNDTDELDRLSNELNRWLDYKKIEDRSNSYNTINLPYNLLYGKKTQSGIIFENNIIDRISSLKNKIKNLLIDIDIYGVDTDDIDVIPFGTRCVAVLKDPLIKITAQKQKQMISFLESAIAST